MLNISVEDFGPIIKGEVELKPLTIFLGPSNSGKSYLATLVYGLMNTVGQSRMHQFTRLGRSTFRRRRRSSSVPGIERNADLSILEQLSNWAHHILDEQDVQLSSLPSPIQTMVQSRVNQVFLGLHESLDDELSNSHGSVSDLVRRKSYNRNLRVKLYSSEPLLSVGFDMTGQDAGLSVSEHNFDISSVKLDGPYLASILGNTRQLSIDESDDYRRFILAETIGGLTSSVWATLAQPFPPNSYYLPAARSGITQGHKVIASTMVRQSPFAGLQPMDIPTLPGVVTDFMSHMLTMETSPDQLRTGRQRRLARLDEVVSFLERHVVKGTIEIEQNTNTPYPEIYYAPHGEEGRFSFNRTSSMVSELAPVILFLKHIVRQGDLLILEEPESHLHPASQQQMARAIVRLVNAGVRVLITTHSDLFLGAINNLMKLSFANQSILAELGREEEDQLKPESVAAYQFTLSDEQGGSEVKRLEIRDDVGIDEDEFSAVVAELYDESILLQRRILE